MSDWIRHARLLSSAPLEMGDRVRRHQMIAIVISEKGGAERREAYDLGEITIGRVKGNDVLLSKGNVSKRHARLIERDGRYIVTDLKSTNGTYVNHRRITHATLVREGDRIYIGDFVLRIEGDALVRSGGNGGAAFDAFDHSSTSASGSDMRVTGLPTHPPTQPPNGSPTGQGDVVSHFPIENDPDESAPHLDMPAAPAFPSDVNVPASTRPDQLSGEHLLVASGAAARHEVSSTGEPPRGPSEPHAGSDRDTRSTEHYQQVLHGALRQLISAIEDELGVNALDGVAPSAAMTERVEEAIATHLGAVAAASGLPATVEAQLREAARAEFLALGPLGELLKDPNITKMQVVLRQVTAHRRGQQVMPSPLPFGSEAGIARALLRLKTQDGSDLQDNGAYLEGTIANGREVFAIRPEGAPGGHLLTIQQRSTDALNLDAMVRAGAISRGMAILLRHCMAGKANVLVTASACQGREEVVGALVASTQRGRSVVWLREGDAPPSNNPMASIHLPSGGTSGRRDAIVAATRVRGDHLIVPALAGEDLAVLLESISSGTEGVVMGVGGSTLHQAIERLSAGLAAERGSVTANAARDWLCAAFDLGIEVTRLGDGRLRVLRVVEFRADTPGEPWRNIFSFAYHRTAAGGSIEGSFYASGAVPRMVSDLAARGMPLDTSIFKRHPSR